MTRGYRPRVSGGGEKEEMEGVELEEEEEVEEEPEIRTGNF